MPTIVPPENTFGNEIGKEGDSGSLSDGIDFFDTDGNHLYKDYSSKNEIRILEKGVWPIAVQTFSEKAQCEDDGLEQFSKGLCDHSTRLDAYKLGDDNGFALLGRIAKFYLKKVGITGVPTGSKESATANALTMLDSKGQRVICIATSNGNISRGTFGSNKYNLVNVLVHEFTHFEKHYSKISNEDGSSTFKGIGVTENEDGGVLRHLQAYWDQILHPTWEKTDMEWKEDQLRVIGKYLTYLSVEDPNVASIWKKKFETACHFKYEKLSNIPDSNEIIWNPK